MLRKIGSLSIGVKKGAIKNPVKEVSLKDIGHIVS
jgi:hypothetical protein